MNDLTQKLVFTTGEAARLCKVSQQTIIRCFDNGRLHGFRVPGSKFRRIPRAELIRFMKDNGIPVDALFGGRKRILIVDDDPKIIELFQDVFERDKNFQIETALTGYDAGLATRAFRPDLIVLDYMLPDINGNIVCERIRQDPDLKDTKIIFVSGVVDPDDVNRLMDAGADDFIKKPFNIDKLIERINELLGIEAE